MDTGSALAGQNLTGSSELTGLNYRSLDFKRFTMALKSITSGLTGNAWAELKSDNVLVFAVPGSPYRGVFIQLLSYQLVVIAVFRITSGFPGTSGSPEVTSPGPWHISTLLLPDYKRVWVSRTSQFSPNLCTKSEPYKKKPVYSDVKLSDSSKSGVKFVYPFTHIIIIEFKFAKSGKMRLLLEKVLWVFRFYNIILC